MSCLRVLTVLMLVLAMVDGAFAAPKEFLWQGLKDHDDVRFFAPESPTPEVVLFVAGSCSSCLVQAAADAKVIQEITAGKVRVTVLVREKIWKLARRWVLKGLNIKQEKIPDLFFHDPGGRFHDHVGAKGDAFFAIFAADLSVIKKGDLRGGFDRSLLPKDLAQ